MRLSTILTLVLLPFSIVDSSSVVTEKARNKDDDRHGQERSNKNEGVHFHQEDEVNVSQKCGAVLLAAGTGLGGALAYALTPAMLCGTAGFCQLGVAKGTSASVWQSTMGNLVAGSTFAQLQSVAMGGAGIYITLTGGMVEGTTA